MIQNRKELDGLLGKWECEHALEYMLQLAEKANVPVQEGSYWPETFYDEKHLCLLTGFCLLLSWGWLEPSYPNSTFRFTKALVDRMRTRECWKDLPYPKTLEQLMEERGRISCFTGIPGEKKP